MHVIDDASPLKSETEESLHENAAAFILSDAIRRPSFRDRTTPHIRTAELAHALHLYLARSATALAALQIEDLLGETLP